MPSLAKPQRRPWQPAPAKRGYQAHQERTILYDSSLWRRMRKAHLARYPLCVECEAEGTLKAATVLDHKVPYRDGSDFFDASNHQGLCASCHARKSAKEGHVRRNKANQP